MEIKRELLFCEMQGDAHENNFWVLFSEMAFVANGIWYGALRSVYVFCSLLWIFIILIVWIWVDAKTILYYVGSLPLKAFYFSSYPILILGLYHYNITFYDE